MKANFLNIFASKYGNCSSILVNLIIIIQLFSRLLKNIEFFYFNKGMSMAKFNEEKGYEDH